MDEMTGNKFLKYLTAYCSYVLDRSQYPFLLMEWKRTQCKSLSWCGDWYQGLLFIPGLTFRMVSLRFNNRYAHSVRDWLTSTEEIKQVAAGKVKRASSYEPSKAAKVDAIVNTIGFPLGT